MTRERDFVNNENINESNSLVHLIEHINPESEEETNLLQHSLYYNNNEFKNILEDTHGKLTILNLNCRSINANFLKLKLITISDFLSVLSHCRKHGRILK